MKLFKTGLVSISFRKLKPEEIISLVAQAGLQGIEWGGDVHVPHGDLKAAKIVAQATRDAGLEVACYGSYYRLADDRPTNPDVQAVLDSALALGAPMIRVWAGIKGSDLATEDDWKRVVEKALAAADLFHKHGVKLVYEYHRNTLTDTIASTQRLLTETAHPAVATLWQPPINRTHQQCLESLEGVIQHLANLHVFHWSFDAAGTVYRQALEHGEPLWMDYLSRVAKLQTPRYCLMEFVINDDSEQFLRDAQALQSWVSRF